MHICVHAFYIHINKLFCMFTYSFISQLFVCALHADKSATPHSRRSLYPIYYIIACAWKLLHYGYYSRIIFSLLLMLLTASMLLVHCVYIYTHMCVCACVCACYILLLKRQLNPLFWMAKKCMFDREKHNFDSWTKVLHRKNTCFDAWACMFAWFLPVIFTKT